MLSRRNQVPFGIVLLLSLCSFGALIAGCATPNWIDAIATRENATNSSAITNPNSVPPPFTGLIHFGLFNGVKQFNYGFSSRPPQSFSIFSEHKDVYSVGYPIACFIFLIIAIIFALVSTIFGLVNTLTVPIETIHGVMGLYLWNAVGAAACLIAWVVYLILYLSHLTRNVLNQEDMGYPNNFRTTSVNFGFSFWLVVVSFFLFLLNILFVFLAHLLQDPNFLRKKKKESEMAKGSGNTVGLGLMY
ncbi:clarin-1-like isoform X2 [Asterias amurensis]|uniref:clarin-1-like isoform X2 n=1 Tax=Asterias amurensis TaxID=7602 RepID=UPI003AB339D4